MPSLEHFIDQQFRCTRAAHGNLFSMSKNFATFPVEKGGCWKKAHRHCFCLCPKALLLMMTSLSFADPDALNTKRQSVLSLSQKSIEEVVRRPSRCASRPYLTWRSLFFCHPTPSNPIFAWPTCPDRTARGPQSQSPIKGPCASCFRGLAICTKHQKSV